VLRHIKGTRAKPDCTYWMCSLAERKEWSNALPRIQTSRKMMVSLLIIKAFSFLILFLNLWCFVEEPTKYAVMMSGWMETISAINWSPFRWKWGVSIPRVHNEDMMVSLLLTAIKEGLWTCRLVTCGKIYVHSVCNLQDIFIL